MASFRDCVVTYIDIIGIKELSANPNSEASRLMRDMHEYIVKEAGHRRLCLHKAYVWNDSVLLLGHPADESEFEAIMREADALKRRIDELLDKKSYAIAVKGKAFPDQGEAHERVIIIAASGWAMANCFEIEAAIRTKKLKRGRWYVDHRIARSIEPDRVSKQIKKIEMLPKRELRAVHVYGGYLCAD